MATPTLRRAARSDGSGERSHRVALAPETERRERPLWQTLAILLFALGLMIVAEIALAFGIARLVTGHAY